jgi:outer membrane protein assembly factor BamB
MISDGLLWTGRYAWGEDPGFTEARDPKTGEVLRQRPPDQEFLPRTGHARCHRAKATSEFLILGRRGVEFVDLQTGGMVANFWLRGICQFGVMPANGLLYVPPHSCACSVDDMLKSGFMALAPRREIESRTEEGQEPTSKNRLVKGPAFGSFERLKSESWDANSGGWPTYRHDRARSGVTPNAVSQDLQLVWETKIGESLTSSVIDEGILLTARKDAHYIHALEATTGRESWTFAAGGRIDSPPTIYRGRVLFGSADGWVYCLRLRDGELAWKFRAAPLSHQIVVDEQLESPWPVSGSVLVLDGAGYFAAGRTSYLEGGMFLYKLDVETGQELRVSRLEVEPERRDGGVASGGHLSDILSSVGDSIFMRSARFDLDLASQKENVPHLWSSVGFLDETWWHRTYWQVGTWMDSGWGRWPKAGQRVPAGRLLVTDGPRVFGFGRNQYDTPGAHVGVDADGVWGPIGREQGRWTYYRLFRQSVNLQAQEEWAKTKNAASPKKIDWTRRLPVLGQAMVLADETLFISGPPDPLEEIPHDPADVDPLAEALETKRGGRLLAISATDGKTLAEHELTSPPIFDGMAAASGYLYLTTKVGTVICLGPRR